jgi:hypothetical protein
LEAGTETITDTDQHLLTSIYSNGVKRDMWRNGTLVFSGSNFSLGNLDDGTEFLIGDDINTGAAIDGTIQAVIIYNADKSADRTAIETALNDYFNIY